MTDQVAFAHAPNSQFACKSSEDSLTGEGARFIKTKSISR